MSVVVKDAAIELADDVCALPLVRRMAALLDRDPGGLADGDPLPRGWHVAFFNPPTPQGHLRHDGVRRVCGRGDRLSLGESHTGTGHGEDRQHRRNTPFELPLHR